MIRFTLALLACFPLASQDYRIAPGGESRVEAIVEKTGLLSGKKHLLRWEKFSGTFSESSGAVSLTVEAASIVVLDDWIGDGKKEDVRKETVGKNVLHAEKYPQIRFASAGPAAGGPNEFTVNGSLTVRGVTKPAVLKVKKISEGVYEGECSFAMTAFGVKPPKALLGAIGTKDEMTVRFRIAGAK
jgi:polyisoprenoid-binding protein YceI